MIRGLGVDLVVGDIPPLAFAAAARAGVPSLAIGNFTWDWIYGIYPAFDRVAPDVIPAIRRAYAHGDARAAAAAARRLRADGGGASRTFPSSRGDRRAIPQRRAGSSASPAIARSCCRPSAATARACRSRRCDGRSASRCIEPVREPPAGLLYQDLVAAADVVVSKPGYGIVSECVANGTALLYTSRGRFIEYDLFVAEMPRMLRCRYLSQEDLLAGRWADAIDALLAQPAAPETPAVDGAAVAADIH